MIKSVTLPLPMGVKPPSGADVILLDDLYSCLAVAGINPVPDFQPINWSPPSGRAVVYVEEVIGQLYEFGIATDTLSVIHALEPQRRNIDDLELDALLEMRDSCGRSDSYFRMLDGSLEGILQRMWSAEKQLSELSGKPNF